jgi:hypothetical protein
MFTLTCPVFHSLEYPHVCFLFGRFVQSSLVSGFVPVLYIGGFGIFVIMSPSAPFYPNLEGPIKSPS